MQATIDLHFMDKDVAYNVVASCIEVLLENKQQCTLQLITGKGAHSSNKQSNLRPTVLEVLAEYKLRHSFAVCEAGRNIGAILAEFE